MKIKKTKEQKVSDLFLNQFVDDKFYRADAIVRYITIREYYKNGAKFFNLYRRMQYLRSYDHGMKEDAKKCSEFREVFFNLADQVKKDGSILKPVRINSHGCLIHGSHRFALALYFGFEFIPVKFKGNKIKDYSISWFERMEFTKSEVQLIKTTIDELKCKFLQ